jgi:Mrp family chromosome partitioning ATPase
MLVFKAKKTRLRTVKDVIERLQTARAHILGGVLNQVPKGQGYQSYTYSYGYHTAQSPATPQTAKRRRGLKFPILK